MEVCRHRKLYAKDETTAILNAEWPVYYASWKFIASIK